MRKPTNEPPRNARSEPMVATEPECPACGEAFGPGLDMSIGGRVLCTNCLQQIILPK